MTALAGKLRHRMTLQKKVLTQDPQSGAFVTTWQDLDTVPTSIEPLSAREYVAAGQVDSKVTTRITIRYRPDISSDMRLVDLDSGRLYNVEGVLADKDSGREYITLPCSEGVNDGR